MGQQRRRPRQLRLHPARPGAPGRPPRSPSPRAAAAPAWPPGCGGGFEAEIGPEYATLLDLLAEARDELPGHGTFVPGPRLAGGTRLGNAGTGPRGSPRRSQGAPAGVSVVVIGLNHRTVPLDLLERMTIERGAPAQGAARPDGPRPRVARPSCSRRATAPRSTSSPSGSTPPTPTSATFLSELAFLPPEELRPTTSTSTTTTTPPSTCSRWPPGSTPPSSARPRSSARSAPRGSGPRPRRPPGRTLNLLFRHALEVGKRARTETAIGAPRRLGVPGRGGHGRRAPRCARGPLASSCWAPARWARAWSARSTDAGVDRRPGRQPHLGAGRRARRPGRRPGHPPRRPAAALAEVDLLLTCTGATSMLIEHADVEPGSRPATGAPAADRRHRRAPRRRPRRRRPARRHPARHGRPAGLRRGRAWPSAAVRSPPSGPSSARSSSATRAVSSAREVAPLVAALREQAEDAPPGRARPLPRPAWPTSTSASSEAVEAAHPRHRGQAAAPAHRGAEGRRRHPQGRAPGRGPPRPLRPLRPRVDRRRGRPGACTCGPRPAAARWPAGRPTTSPRCSTPSDARARAVEAVVVETVADRRLDIPIWEMGGKGVFVKEVQAAVLDGRADLAVHSAKDLPSTTPDGLVHRRRARAGRPPRRPRRAALWPTSRRAPWSPPARLRRRAQLAWPPPGPHLRRAAGQHGHPPRRRRPTIDAIVVAARRARAARLGPTRWPRCSSRRSMLPQVGQGALAVECRADDAADPGAAGRHRARAQPPRRRRRAGVPGRARRRLRPPRRRLRRGRRRRARRRGPRRLPRRSRRAPPRRDRRRPRGRRPGRGPLPPRRRRRLGDTPPVRPRRRVLADWAGASGAERALGDRLPGGGGAGGPGAADRAGGRAAGPGRRRRLRPAVGGDPARPGPGRAPSGSAWASSPAAPRPARTRSTPCWSSTAGPVGRSCASRAATPSSSPAAARRPGPCSRPASPSRSCPASPRPSPPRPTPASRSPSATRPPRSPSSPATRTPSPGVEGTVDWDAVARVGGTIVILMGVARMAAIAERLIAGGRSPDTPAAAVQWGTRPEQRTVRATLATLADHDLAAPVHHRGRRGGGRGPGLVREPPAVGPDRRGHPARGPGQRAGRRPAAGRGRAVGAPGHRDRGPRRRRARRWPPRWPTSAATTGWSSPRPTAPAGVLAGLPDARALGGVAVAAIGPGTADALADGNIRADLVPERFVAESLLEAFPAPPADGGRVLLARAAVARDTLPDGLAGRRLGRRRGRGLPHRPRAARRPPCSTPPRTPTSSPSPRRRR